MSKLKLHQLGGTLAINDVTLGNDGKNNVLPADAADDMASELGAMILGNFFRRKQRADSLDYCWRRL
jgi:hypothetical protein